MEGNKTLEVFRSIDQIDQDGDGNLNLTEIKVLNPSFLQSIGMPHGDASEMLRQFDKNGDKQMDLGERQALIGRVVPQLTQAVEEIAATQDFEAALGLDNDLEALKKSMSTNFRKYLDDKEAQERAGLYNFSQFSLMQLDQDFARQIQETEEQFAKRKETLHRQFAMKSEVLLAEIATGRRPGSALVPKPTCHSLELRSSLHHLSKQKRFAEAIELQASIDDLESEQLKAFYAAQPVYVAQQTAKLQEQFKEAADRLVQRRRAAIAKLEDEALKSKARLKNQNAIYKHRLEHCHTKSAQDVAIVGARPVRMPKIPTLPNLHHAATLNAEPERTRGGGDVDGKYQLTLPRVQRNENGWRRPMHAPSTYMVEPIWTRKGLATTTPLQA